MAEKSRHHTIDLSLAGARAGGRPYLGDVEAVQDMLRLYAQQIMERLIQASKLEIDLDTAIAMDQQEAYRLADVFLGKHPEQANPMPGWNEPGAIDFFVANATGMDDTKPEDRLAHLFSHLVEKAHESAHAADADPQDEDWADAVNDAVTMVSHLLIGVTLPDEVADTNAFNEAVGNSKG